MNRIFFNDKTCVPTDSVIAASRTGSDLDVFLSNGMCLDILFKENEKCADAFKRICDVIGRGCDAFPVAYGDVRIDNCTVFMKK